MVDTMGQEIEIHPVNQLAISSYIVTYDVTASRRSKEVNSIPDIVKAIVVGREQRRSHDLSLYNTLSD